MFSFHRVGFAALAVFLLPAFVTAAEPVLNPENGHYYTWID